MCGRFSLSSNPNPWLWRFGVDPLDFIPRYNISPSQDILILSFPDRQQAGRLVKPGALLARWGLVPSWAKDPSIGHKMINARAETLEEKPSFKNLLKNRRCLIPADGFYEWKRETRGKTPYRFVKEDREIFAFAGLWSTWKTPDGKPLLSCTIITTAANSLVSAIHGRMPAIINPKHYEIWLDPARGIRLEDLLSPYPAELMDHYPVSSLVNSPRNDIPEVIIPA